MATGVRMQASRDWLGCSFMMVAWLVYMLLGLDALSSQLEEPFGTQENDLPLDAIVRLVEREIHSALGQPLPPSPQAVRFNLR